ncbi:zeta toxin family protein [Spirosoma pomorum]
MKSDYSRLLIEPVLVAHFFSRLGYDYSKDSKIIPKVAQAQMLLDGFDKTYPTLNSKRYRSTEFSSDKIRWELRRRIVDELFGWEREVKDDNICLGTGGALPHNPILYDKQAFLLIGLPASGKSSIANKIADTRGAVILDSDYAKRKLPEFDTYDFGATLVHDESDALIFGDYEDDQPADAPYLLKSCVAAGANIVIPKIGHNLENIIRQARSYRDELGYQVHLTLVNLDRRKATIRAIERFKDSGRYVPLGLIFDGYSNEPILNYYILKCKHDNLFASIGEISTDVPRDQPPICFECIRNNPSNIYASV